MTDIEKIKAALKPFAEIAKYCTGLPESDKCTYGVNVGDLRRAAEAYAELEAAQGLIDKPVIEGGRNAVLQEAAEIARAEQLRQLSKRGNNDLDEAWQIHNYGAVVSANIYDAIRSLSAVPALEKEGVVMPEWNELPNSIQRVIGDKADITMSYTANLYGFIRKQLSALPAPVSVQEQKT